MDRASANPSYWRDGPAQSTYPSLSEDTQAQVAIVGGGITGLTAASRLRAEGRTVALIEMNWIGSGTTGSSTGHLDCYSDHTLKGLVRSLGEDHARIALHAKRAAIDQVEQWDRRFQLDCQFRRIPAYLYCEDESDVELLERECAYARRLGLSVDMQQHAPLPFHTSLCLVFPDQARLDPLAYRSRAGPRGCQGRRAHLREHPSREDPRGKRHAPNRDQPGDDHCRRHHSGRTCSADGHVHGRAAGHAAPVLRTAPYIGRVPNFDRIYMGAAFSGDGLTFGTVAGIVTSDLVLGRQNAAAQVFDPGRIRPLSSVRRLAGNLLHVARHFVVDRITGAEFESVDQISRGQGGLMTVDGERLAVFRDEHGDVHMMSPLCRHMGCYVHWNAAEKTWDCPCHGGRYDARGNVIMGPPKHPLERRAPMGVETR
jgi:glycine/D-amino acid oxidase-like deaminating enzyme/nitrite reductase/ring-hydroxylating ferredoxin subunit